MGAVIRIIGRIKVEYPLLRKVKFRDDEVDELVCRAGFVRI